MNCIPYHSAMKLLSLFLLIISFLILTVLDTSSNLLFCRPLSNFKNTNICGILKDTVVVSPILIDVDQFHPWTSFDIESTIDSISTAMEWIKNKADNNQQNLANKIIPHEQKRKRSINEQLIKPRFVKLNIDLLDSDKKNIKVTWTNGSNMEYAVINDKNSAIITHKFLHLFGVVDLYPNSTDPNFSFNALAKAYPNEILRIQHQSIESLIISLTTQYYIGWQKNLDESDTRMLSHQYEVVPY